MAKYTTPKFENSALITIDVQCDFSIKNAIAEIPGTEEKLPKMKEVLEIYRKNNLPIIHVVRIYKKDGSNVDLCRREAIEKGKSIVAPGSKGAELADELKPNKDIKLDANCLLNGEFQELANREYAMYKPRWGAFYQTKLEEKLTELKVNTLVVIGCNFPNCPRTTIYEASERDFRVVLIKDAMSQLYDKGEEELRNIGTELINAAEIPTFANQTRK